MNFAPQPAPQADPVQQHQDTAPSRQAPAVPLPGLKETLAEAHETIQMVEQALTQAPLADDEDTRYIAFMKACAKGDQEQVLTLLATGIALVPPATNWVAEIAADFANAVRFEPF